MDERAPDHRSLGLRDGLPGLRDLMDRLLDPERGCPWDQVQTLDTLRPYLLEEAHEVLEAMHDPRAHRGELGDLLFQVVFHAALREREGAFDLDGVVEAIRSKMIRRHPHVFGDPVAGPRAQGLTPQDVERQWAAIKASERRRMADDGADGPPDPLAGVPRGLPALQRAWRLQDKAAQVGFDWPDVEGALGKVREEWEELEQARHRGDVEEVREELGDLLFVLVRVASKLGVEPEDALRRANAKFERRFGYVMERCHAEGIAPQQAGLAVLDAFWDQAKARERATIPTADDPHEA
ncbi:nucleoside triphosphate pyrophosphohydrolase [Paraliomyxa miuraensis]|uniref:nucleoside triphosphate pyrophosphohydrolase n=1 Tax=Paraliomyxa miuraensis TaxID=376150 RepID=UPI0022509A0F|nr:nucleoside triphosphate pyrophosphohydrolase [Paraliomyxa miuraensis]MCX4245580.1 nucleoside triphosphate pyrophosphohydrolase [Paraliomyxa miuraensis]